MICDKTQHKTSAKLDIMTSWPDKTDETKVTLALCHQYVFLGSETARKCVTVINTDKILLHRDVSV